MSEAELSSHNKKKLALEVGAASVAVGAGIAALLKLQRHRKQRDDANTEPIDAAITPSQMKGRRQRDSTLEHIVDPTHYREQLKIFSDASVADHLRAGLIDVAAYVYVNTFLSQGGSVSHGSLFEATDLSENDHGLAMALLEEQGIIAYREEAAKKGEAAGYFAGEALTWLHDSGSESDAPDLHTAIALRLAEISDVVGYVANEDCE